jgi:hypothetical protein
MSPLVSAGLATLLFLASASQAQDRALTRLDQDALYLKLPLH